GLGELAADVLLGEEVGGAQRLGMVRIDGREQLADQRQGPGVAAPGLGAAGGITAHGESLAALAEVSRILGVLRDLPATGKTDAVRMEQAPVSLPIRSPAQVGVGIDRALGGLEERRRTA